MRSRLAVLRVTNAEAICDQTKTKRHIGDILNENEILAKCREKEQHLPEVFLVTKDKHMRTILLLILFLRAFLKFHSYR